MLSYLIFPIIYQIKITYFLLQRQPNNKIVNIVSKVNLQYKKQLIIYQIINPLSRILKKYTLSQIQMYHEYLLKPNDRINAKIAEFIISQQQQQQQTQIHKQKVIQQSSLQNKNQQQQQQLPMDLKNLSSLLFKKPQIKYNNYNRLSKKVSHCIFNPKYDTMLLIFQNGRALKCNIRTNDVYEVLGMQDLDFLAIQLLFVDQVHQENNNRYSDQNTRKMENNYRQIQTYIALTHDSIIKISIEHQIKKHQSKLQIGQKDDKRQSLESYAYFSPQNQITCQIEGKLLSDMLSPQNTNIKNKVNRKIFTTYNSNKDSSNQQALINIITLDHKSKLTLMVYKVYAKQNQLDQEQILRIEQQNQIKGEEIKQYKKSSEVQIVQIVKQGDCKIEQQQQHNQNNNNNQQFEKDLIRRSQRVRNKANKQNLTKRIYPMNFIPSYKCQSLSPLSVLQLSFTDFQVFPINQQQINPLQVTMSTKQYIYCNILTQVDSTYLNGQFLLKDKGFNTTCSGYNTVGLYDISFMTQSISQNLMKKMGNDNQYRHKIFQFEFQFQIQSQLAEQIKEQQNEMSKQQQFSQLRPQLLAKYTSSIYQYPQKRKVLCPKRVFTLPSTLDKTSTVIFYRMQKSKIEQQQNAQEQLQSESQPTISNKKPTKFKYLITVVYIDKSQTIIFQQMETIVQKHFGSKRNSNDYAHLDYHSSSSYNHQLNEQNISFKHRIQNAPFMIRNLFQINIEKRYALILGTYNQRLIEKNPYEQTVERYFNLSQNKECMKYLLQQQKAKGIKDGSGIMILNLSTNNDSKNSKKDITNINQINQRSVINSQFIQNELLNQQTVLFSNVNSLNHNQLQFSIQLPSSELSYNKSIFLLNYDKNRSRLQTKQKQQKQSQKYQQRQQSDQQAQHHGDIPFLIEVKLFSKPQLYRHILQQIFRQQHSMKEILYQYQSSSFDQLQKQQLQTQNKQKLNPGNIDKLYVQNQEQKQLMQERKKKNGEQKNDKFQQSIHTQNHNPAKKAEMILFQQYQQRLYNKQGDDKQNLKNEIMENNQQFIKLVIEMLE